MKTKTANVLEPKIKVHPNTLFSTRLFVLMFYFTHIVMSTVAYGPIYFARSILFLTCWAFWITFAKFILITFHHKPDHHCEFYSQLTLFTLNLNLEVTLGYWILVHPNLEPKFGFEYYDYVMIHIFPLVITIVDFAFNQIEIKRFHWKILLFSKMIYSIWNLFLVKVVLGHPIYDFLDWNGFSSVVVIFVLTSLSMFTGYLMYFYGKRKFKKID